MTSTSASSRSEAAASRELVPRAVDAGALCIDKSAAFRLEEGIPLVVPEVNGERAREHSGIVANPNCCSIPLAMVLAPLRDAAGLRAVRVATYQSAAGAGSAAMERLREEQSDHAPADGLGLRRRGVRRGGEAAQETRKILELSDLPVSATCVRVPVLVGHAEALWVETDERLAAGAAQRRLWEAAGLRLEPFPTPAGATGLDDVLVGRIREDAAAENGLALFFACDNLRKGAALNAIQIVELLIEGSGKRRRRTASPATVGTTDAAKRSSDSESARWRSAPRQRTRISS